NSEQDMLFGEEQMATIAFTGKFDPNIGIGPAAKSAGTRVGERVEAKSMQSWYKAYIVDSRPGEQKAHYYGYESSDDEWIPDNRIRTSKPTQFAKGSKVEVEWQGKWWAATVVDVRGGSHFITYDGYGKEWDEWVTSKRIRKQ
ncbi:MAG TPA: Tudor-knot domain-containing protein, partial [Pyrinomonadaceae bacterium]|nr:Tudor-knot domain-containing protein [Pyrinomonadaceae bacterium]